MRIVLLLAAGLLVLSGCGSQTPPATADSGTQSGGTGRSVDYDFSGTTLDGGRFEGTRLEGKPAVLWFWAPWCPTCRGQMANVSKLAQQYDGEVSVIGVGGLDDEEAIRDLAAEIPHVTHLVDDEGEVWKHFRVTAQSTYTVIGSDGEIEAEGYLEDADLNALVEQLAG